MEFRVLGPLEVVKDGRSIGLGGNKQRLVLAHLVLRAGQTVASEVLIDAVWGEEPPPTARGTLQTYISRLRAVVGDDRIQGRAGGYRLEAAPDELDLARFEGLVLRAQAESDADPQAAADTFREALSIWRGSAFSDLADEPSLRGETARLEELRLGATEGRISVQLQLGQETSAVSELESLTERYPLRERLWANLMLALYRTGRQAEALAAFRRARTALAEELGIDPSSALVRLHEQILSHDPGLELAESHPRAQIRTFLIADVRGYTLFTQERGDEAAGKLAAKFADIAREGVEARGGTLLELRGDEALCVFASAREAIRAAVELQERFVEATLEHPELPLTVGIGLDAGEAVAVQAGYRGGALNLAARLCGQARAGEILASPEVTHLARRVDGVRYEDRGPLRFKGISDPIAVVRVAPEGDDPVDRLRPFARPGAPQGMSSRRWAFVGAIVLVLALPAISIPILTSDDSAGDVEIGSNSVARMSAHDGSVQLATELGQRPGASAIGFGSVWVAQPDRGVVTRLDVKDGSVTDTIRVGTAPAGVAIGEGSVWVTNAAVGTVSRINVQTNEVSQELPAGSGPSGIAFGEGALWVADSVGAALLRIDPTSGGVKTVPLAGAPTGVAFTSTAVWVSVAPNTVVRIDPADLTVTLTQPVGSGPTAVVSAFDSIWVTNHLDGTVSRVDPSTGRVEATVEVGQGPNALAATEDSLWVANEFGGSIRAIDPESNDAVATVPVGEAATSLAIDGDAVWLALGASASEHRGGTLRASSVDPAPTSLDPALAYDPLTWQILTITNDGLVGYKRVGGPDGATLMPDMASALPEVSADGLSYRFPLRPGIRYSTGSLVLPEDFRRGMERSISLSPPAADLFSAIEGADACTGEPDPCDLSQSIVVDEESVTYHLASPDPDLPLKLALPFAFPVPDATPVVDQGLEPVPATGPYMVAETGADQIQLVRNPEFEEWSGAAQPDGFVNEISLTFADPLDDAFDQLVAGDLDLMLYPPRPEDLAILRSTHPDRIVSYPAAFTFFVGFDVLKPPFDDQRVRQALNFAIDRAHVVDLLGGPMVHQVTCQMLPPNFPGHAPLCPYTLDPKAGAWSAPDLGRGQALVEEAGAAGEPVTVWVTSGIIPAGRPVEAMRYVTGVLNQLGLRAHLRIVQSGDAYFNRYVYGSVPGTPAHPQVFIDGWASDYQGAGGFIDVQFSCGGSSNVFGWCDEELDTRIDEASMLHTTDPDASNQAWAEIEHQLVEDAAFAALTNPFATHAISARAENLQVNPQWGVLLSRLWVQ